MIVLRRFLNLRLPEQQQVILRVARDTAIDNGFGTGREILLRYQKGF